jgi:hypothetical protein
MALTSEENREFRHATVILRLLLDRLEHLVHGEVVSADGTSGGRFRNWREMPDLVQALLARQRRATDEDAEGHG